MKRIISIVIAIYLTLPSCVIASKKMGPEYKGIDPKAQSVFDEYMSLSKQNNIRFSHEVTIGLKSIDEGTVVGTCTSGLFFREIDLDVGYWNYSTYTTKMALLFHELTHCYCGRSHDYGENMRYPEKEKERVLIAIKWRETGGPRQGYLDDGCPVSLMHPVVVPDDCMRNHYDAYTKEMFDRCRPY